MSNKRDVGNYGEVLAVNYLKELGYEILKLNWRFRYWEVDIIAKDNGILVFVEVKSRSNTNYGNPADFVDYKKQQNLLKIASAYINRSRYEGEIRFDIVSVYLETKKIELIKDAFWSS